MSEEVVEQKKSFFSDRFNLILMGILVLAFILRLIYFNMNQALWWDEADWLSIAKHWAFGVPFEASSMRPPFFPAIAALMYLLGANEFVLRLFMFAVSIVGVYLTYLVARDLFDKRVALLATFIVSVSYVALFYTARILLDLPMMVMWLLAVWFFLKGYVKDGPKYYLWLMGITIAFGSSMKLPFILIAAPLLVYVFFNEGFAMFKNRRLWFGVLFFFLALLPYMIYFYVSYGGLPFISSPAYGFGQGQMRFLQYAQLFPLILQSSIPFLNKASSWFFNSLLLLFLFGLGYMIMSLFLGWDLVRKERSLKIYLFLLVWIVVPYAFFSLIEWVEDRYLLMVYPAAFMIAGFALVKCYDFIKKHNKIIALAFVLLVLFDAAYYQLSYADNLIKLKSSSYVQFRYAGLWMKERTNETDMILNSGVPQTTYYAERNTSFFPEKEEDFDKFVSTYKPKFMVLSVLERSPEWTYTWPQQHPDLVVPVQGYFADEAQKQPILVIYQFVYNSTS